MKEIIEKLKLIEDPKYAEFQSKLVPNCPKESFIGVRVPQLRNFAKEFEKDDKCREFLDEPPHETYDENLLHSILISRTQKFDICLTRLEAFLPFVDNWAVCDTMRPYIFAKNTDRLYEPMLRWIRSDLEYTCRFGLDMLMTYYLDKQFQPEYLEIAAQVKSDAYYVKMMVAWYFATALAKQWDASIGYIENRRLPEWTHKTTIRKACESYRITDEQKTYLKRLK